MSLKCEPASEPLHISVKWLFSYSRSAAERMRYMSDSHGQIMAVVFGYKFSKPFKVFTGSSSCSSLLSLQVLEGP